MTNTKAQHTFTPGPWRIEAIVPRTIDIKAGHNALICRVDNTHPYGMANAEFIVHAMNNQVPDETPQPDTEDRWSKLKATNAELMVALKSTQKEISYIIKHLSDQQPVNTIPKAWFEAEKIALDAIEKAEDM